MKNSFSWCSDGNILYNQKQFNSFRNGVTEKYTQGDRIGCGYDPYRNEIYWTKNGQYLGNPLQCHNPDTPDPLALYPAITKTPRSQSAIIPCEDLLFDPATLDAIYQNSEFEVSLAVRNFSEIHLLGHRYLLDCEDIVKYFPFYANVAQFSSLFQLLLKAFAEANPSIFTKMDLTKYYENINDNVLVGIGEILPSSTTTLTLGRCIYLNECYFNCIPNFSQIAKLDFCVGNDVPRASRLSDKSMECLVNVCTQLRHIRVWESISKVGLLHLAKAKRTLRTLDISNCSNIYDEDLSNLLKQLDRTLSGLIIDQCDKLTESILETISSTQPQLKKLSMERNSYPEVNVISAIRDLNNLRALGLGGITGSKYCLTNEVVWEISQWLPKLKSLGLYRAKITDESLEYLSKCLHLEELNIGLTDISIGKLVRVPWKKLSRLALWGCKRFTDQDLYQLVNRFKFTELSLYYCTTLTPTGIQLAMQYLDHCEYLNLASTQTDNSIVSCLSLTMPALKKIDLRVLQPDTIDFEKLQADNPRLTIIHPLSNVFNIDGHYDILWDNSRAVNVHRRKVSVSNPI